MNGCRHDSLLFSGVKQFPRFCKWSFLLRTVNHVSQRVELATDYTLEMIVSCLAIFKVAIFDVAQRLSQ